MKQAIEIKYVAEVQIEDWQKLERRGSVLEPSKEMLSNVAEICREIEELGDAALVRATAVHDGVELAEDQLRVADEEFDRARNSIDAGLLASIRRAIEAQIAYNEHVKEAGFRSYELAPGVIVGRRSLPLSSAGLYVPCGKATYPSTLITIAAPAKVAGVSDLKIVLPPREDGSVDSAVLVAADLLGIRSVFRGNGVAGIFALAVGTKQIGKVKKIVGPGGPMIAAAQMYAITKGVDTALYFGPSECMIVCDETADPDLLAADLINEAEHGEDSSAILITTSEEIARQVQRAMETQLRSLAEPRKRFARAALSKNSGILIAADMETAIEVANRLGNEHIQVAAKDAWEIAMQLNSASEILIGQNTTFSAISYAIGVPACLPTGQATGIYSPVTVDTFMRRCAVAQLSAGGLGSIAETIETLAEHEGFDAHRRSIEIRREQGVLEAV